MSMSLLRSRIHFGPLYLNANTAAFAAIKWSARWHPGPDHDIRHSGFKPAFLKVRSRHAVKHVAPGGERAPERSSRHQHGIEVFRYRDMDLVLARRLDALFRSSGHVCPSERACAAHGGTVYVGRLAPLSGVVYREAHAQRGQRGYGGLDHHHSWPWVTSDACVPVSVLRDGFASIDGVAPLASPSRKAHPSVTANTPTSSAGH